MKRFIFTLIFAGLALLTGLGLAMLSTSRSVPVDAQALAAANELVAAGHYAEAAQMYDQMIAQGVHHAAVYYNLGNAALSLGDVSRAAGAFEQAAVLAPRDADIRANLALAQQQAQNQVNRPSASPPGGLVDITSRWLTIDELALLALVAWFALGMLVFAYRGLQPERRPVLLRAAMGLALVVVLATGGLLASRIATPRLAAPATLMDQQAAVPAGISG